MVAQLPPKLFRDEALQHRLARNPAQSLLQQSNWIYLLTLCVLGLTLAVVLLLALTGYKSTESARGVLMAEQPAIQQVSPQAGVIEQILVTHGQLVEQGTVLATISGAVFDAQGEPIGNYSLNQLETELESLAREADLEERRHVYRLEALESLVQDYQRQAALANTSLQTLDNQLKLSGDLLQASRTLYEQGALPRVQYEKQHLAKLQLDTDYQSGMAKKYELDMLLSQTRSKAEAIGLEWEQTQSELTRNKQLLESQIQQTRKQETLSVVARRKGIVASIPVSTGDPVEAGEPLIYLQPDSQVLAGEVYVPSRTMGVLAPGQELLLSYDSFDVESYGRYSATIVEIDRASIDHRDHRLPLDVPHEAVFPVRIELQQHFVEGDDIFPLQPGLQFTAEFVTAEMTLIEFIFRPLLRLQGKLE